MAWSTDQFACIAGIVLFKVAICNGVESDFFSFLNCSNEVWDDIYMMLLQTSQFVERGFMPVALDPDLTQRISAIFPSVASSLPPWSARYRMVNMICASIGFEQEHLYAGSSELESKLTSPFEHGVSTTDAKFPVREDSVSIPFCHSGRVSLLFWQARLMPHAMMEFLIEDDADLQCKVLCVAWLLLQNNELNFLAETRWTHVLSPNAVFSELRANHCVHNGRTCLREYKDRDDEVRREDEFCDDVSSEARVGTTFAPGFFVGLYGLFTSWKPKPLTGIAEQKGMLKVSIISSHGGFSRLVESALQFERTVHNVVEIHFLGQFLYCHFVGTCQCRLAEFLRTWALYYEDEAKLSLGDSERSAIESSVSEIVGYVYAMFHDNGEHHDLVIVISSCFGWLLSWFVRLALPSGAASDSVRMVHILDHTALHSTPAILHHSVRGFIRGLAFCSDGFDIVVVPNSFRGVEALQLVDVVLPVVPLYPFYMERYRRTLPSSNQIFKLLVLASKTLRTSFGIYFLCLIRHYVMALNNLFPVLALDHIVQDGYADEISHMQAALFLPDARYKILFYDIYALNIPMLVPDGDFYVRSYVAERSDNEAHPMFAGRRAQELPEASVGASHFMSAHVFGTHDYEGMRDMAKHLSLRLSRRLVTNPRNRPHNEWACESIEKLRSWWDLSEMAHFPGVLHFSSGADIFAKLANNRLLLTSQRESKVENTQLRQKALYFWHGILGGTL